MSYKDQFKLVKSGENMEDYNNKYSFLNAPTTYAVEEVTPDNMHPFNQFEGLKNASKYITADRRDNTVIIKNYNSNEVGMYAIPKIEIKNLFEPMKNDNALAGDTKIVDKTGLNRYGDTLKYKSNEYAENMYVRAELIDGVPIQENVRPREKQLDELRGLGVNSVRLSSDNRTNNTKFEGMGESVDPATINITKFKMKSYRDQNSVDDLLRTTGVITRPEWRSLVQEPSTDRSYFKTIDGPPVSSVMKEEYRNNDAMRPTIKEETIENNYISNPYGFIGKQSLHYEDSARPTIKEETIHNNYISNAMSSIGKEEYRNNESALPTLREDKTFILNPKSLIEKPVYNNNQAAIPTLREDKTFILNPKSLVEKPVYNNNQAAIPTLREDFSVITNPKSLIEKPVYNNNQAAIPTLREEFSVITNPKSLVEKPIYNNNQAAIPTLREEMSVITNPKSLVEKPVYNNNQSALPTLREDTMITINGANNMNAGYVYENSQTANPTIREEDNKEYFGGVYNFNKSLAYENNQAIRPTLRILYEEKNMTGGAFNNNSTYKKYGDITRSGVVEEVLAKDYMGSTMAFVTKNESHEQFKNMVQNEAIENSIDLTKRDLMGGGTDRIPQGKKDIGVYSDWNKREKTPEVINRVRNVGVNYIQEIPDTRGYNILQERSPINQYVKETINNNPFVNNILYSGTNMKDIIRENTVINDREPERLVK